MSGWIKLHRKILDSRVWANDGLLKAWLHCLLHANHKESWATIDIGKGQSEVFIPRGSFLCGRISLGKSLKTPPSTAWGRMKKLEAIGNISIKTDSHYSIITVINWDTYQGGENENQQPSDSQPTASQQPSDSQPTASQQPSDTNKNDKNGENGENDKNGENILLADQPTKETKKTHLDFVKLTETEYANLIEKYGSHKTEEMIQRLNAYVGSTGKRYKSHYFTIMTWMQKEPTQSIFITKAGQQTLTAAQKFLQRREEEQANEKS